MATIKVSRSHHLGCEEARSRVDAVAKSLKKEFNIDCAWHGDRLNFKRTGASGTIDVKDDSVRLKIKLGLLLAPMKNVIKESVKQYMDREFG